MCPEACFLEGSCHVVIFDIQDRFPSASVSAEWLIGKEAEVASALADGETGVDWVEEVMGDSTELAPDEVVSAFIVTEADPDVLSARGRENEIVFCETYAVVVVEVKIVSDESDGFVVPLCRGGSAGGDRVILLASGEAVLSVFADTGARAAG